MAPFHHLATVLAEPFDGGVAVVMVTIGTALALAGQLLFNRRDVVAA